MRKAPALARRHILPATAPWWFIKDYSFNMEITLMYLSELERHLPNLLVNEM